MEVLVVYARQHSKGAVAAGAVVEYLKVFEECSGELDSGAPLLPVEQFGLQPAPERLDDCIVVAISEGAHRWHQTGLSDALRQARSDELGAVVGVDHRAACWHAIGERCGECVGDQ